MRNQKNGYKPENTVPVRWLLPALFGFEDTSRYKTGRMIRATSNLADFLPNTGDFLPRRETSGRAGSWGGTVVSGIYNFADEFQAPTGRQTQSRRSYPETFFHPTVLRTNGRFLIDISVPVTSRSVRAHVGPFRRLPTSRMLTRTC